MERLHEESFTLLQHSQQTAVGTQALGHRAILVNVRALPPGAPAGAPAPPPPRLVLRAGQVGLRLRPVRSVERRRMMLGPSSSCGPLLAPGGGEGHGPALGCRRSVLARRGKLGKIGAQLSFPGVILTRHDLLEDLIVERWRKTTSRSSPPGDLDPRPGNLENADFYGCGYGDHGDGG